MSGDQTVARTLHDLGAAAWFGGALMGVSAIDRASKAVAGDSDRIRVADEAWQSWQPWKAAAIGVHVAGSLALVWGNKGRLAGQRGAMTVNILKTGVFGAALAADLYAVVLGREIAEAQPPTEEPAVEPLPQTTDGVAEKKRRLRAVQWTVAALTGLNIVLAAKMGEQQRPTSVARGVMDRFRRT